MKKYIMSYQEHVQLLNEQKSQEDNPNKEDDINTPSTEEPKIYTGNPSKGKIDDTPLTQGEEPVQKNKDIVPESSKRSNKPLF